MKCCLLTIFLVVSSSLLLCQNYEQTIYVSQLEGVDESNDGSDINNPIKSLLRAKQIARFSSAVGFNILLKSGEIFDEHTPFSNSVLTEYDKTRSLFAFVWDINKPLYLSTYGSAEKAVLYSGKYTFEGGSQNAIAVTSPSTKKVTIENIHLNNLKCNIATETGIYINGLPQKPIENIYLQNILITKTFVPNLFNNVKCLGIIDLQIN